MSREMQIEIPEEEMGMSGYSKYSWKLHSTKKFTMAQAQLADQIMREEGYRKPSEWISVEERLPQVTGKYICCVKDKGENTWTIPADWSLELKMWFGEFGEIKNMVTHWMPLPEAPKMKGGEEK